MSWRIRFYGKKKALDIFRRYNHSMWRKVRNRGLGTPSNEWVDHAE
jgi:hypothetical protein